MAFVADPMLTAAVPGDVQFPKESTNGMRPAKLFIGGITKNTTTKQLRDHFSKYGRVLDCVAMRQADGRPRGFGYVTLDSSAAADHVVAEPQMIDGRVVDMKRAVPEGSMASAPVSRLHTPTGPAAKRPTPQPLQASFGHWQEPPISPFGYYGSPTHGLLPDVDAACPWANPAVAAAAAAAAAAATLAEATAYQQQGLSSPYLPAPDCMELLSRAQNLFASTPRVDLQQPSVLGGFPATPTAGIAGLMSAAAPEFVPIAGPRSPSVPTEAGACTRSVLGEITNQVNSKKAPEKPAVTVPEPQEPGLVLRQPEKSLKIDTENIENIAPAALPEPAAEISPAHAAIALRSEPDAESEEQSDESDEESGNEVVYDGPLPSLGSADHAAGTCKRCNFFPKGRCQNGENCTFCHLPHKKRKHSRQEKRERKAAWAAQTQEDDKEGEMTLAYSVLPGLPPMRTAKLPTPLTLPGGNLFGPMPPTPLTLPAPPPGLGLEQCHWQPDEEISPMRSQVPPPVLATAPLLATVPVSPSASVPSPSSASLQATLSSTPSEGVAMKQMVTIATQTAEEEQKQEGNVEGTVYTREQMLNWRTMSGKNPDGLPLRTLSLSNAEAN